MRVLVTGATGFVGRHLVHLLQARRHTVIATCHAPSKTGTLPGVAPEPCDVRDFSAVRYMMKRARPDRIFHLAAFSSVRSSFEDVRTVYEVNFGGTLNLLQAAREAAPESRVLIVGSGQSYGSVKRGNSRFERRRPLRRRARMRPAKRQPTLAPISSSGRSACRLSGHGPSITPGRANPRNLCAPISR